MEMLPPAPSVGEVPDDDETASTTALIAQVPRIALEELARRMLENPGSVSRADFEAALAGHDDGESTVAFGDDDTVRLGDDDDDDDDEALPAAQEEGDANADDANADDDNASPRAPARRGGPTAIAGEGEGGARTTSSRFWGVTWARKDKKWQAYYKDAAGKTRHLGFFDDDEEAAHAVNKAISDAGLEGKRRMNAVDATGALVPRERPLRLDRAAVVAPDPARDPTATTSKFWGVSWDKKNRRWQACYKDANGKKRTIGRFDTQEAAAHAVNAAIRRAGLEGRRKTNPVVDGQLVPRARKARGHGPPRKSRKRRRDEPAAAAPPSPRARRR